MIKVLIAEDELPTARYIAKLVDQHPSFQTVATEINGERALQYLRAHPVDLIISDIQMPLMDGLQLLEAVRREFPHCMTVILTGFSYFEYARTALQHQAFDYLLKPIDAQSFRNMLCRVENRWKEHGRVRTRTMLEEALSGRSAAHCSETFHVILADTATLNRGILPPCHVFHGADTTATDLRGGASLVIAALAAHGESSIGALEHLDRGYAHLEEQLRALGADVERKN